MAKKTIAGEKSGEGPLESGGASSICQNGGFSNVERR
jgi:hypothetical protein